MVKLFCNILQNNQWSQVFRACLNNLGEKFDKFFGFIGIMRNVTIFLLYPCLEYVDDLCAF